MATFAKDTKENDQKTLVRTRDQNQQYVYTPNHPPHHYSVSIPRAPFSWE